MDRRGFIKGLGLLIAAPAIVRLSSLMPVSPLLETIYGDGVHCDAAGLSAFLRGDKVRNLAGVRLLDKTAFLPAMTFYLRDKLIVPGNVTLDGNGCQAILAGPQPAIEFSGEGAVIKSCRFWSEGAAGLYVTPGDLRLMERIG